MRKNIKGLSYGYEKNTDRKGVGAMHKDQKDEVAGKKGFALQNIHYIIPVSLAVTVIITILVFLP